MSHGRTKAPGGGTERRQVAGILGEFQRHKSALGNSGIKRAIV